MQVYFILKVDGIYECKKYRSHILLHYRTINKCYLKKLFK